MFAREYDEHDLRNPPPLPPPSNPHLEDEEVHEVGSRSEAADEVEVLTAPESYPDARRPIEPVYHPDLFGAPGSRSVDTGEAEDRTAGDGVQAGWGEAGKPGWARKLPVGGWMGSGQVGGGVARGRAGHLSPLTGLKNALGSMGGLERVCGGGCGLGRDWIRDGADSNSGVYSGGVSGVTLGAGSKGSDARQFPKVAVSYTQRRRALLVGINYKRTPGARRLEGCVNDCKWMHHLLTTRFGFKSEDIWVLTDEPAEINAPVKRFIPTRNNILNGMRWIVNGATAGSHCFWSFSGHGGRVRDTNGDEDDGWDETILPVDFPSAGQIVDDEIHEIMVKGLCKGARLTAVMDCCHSGTGMDLPYVHSPYVSHVREWRVPMAVSQIFARARKMKRKREEKTVVSWGLQGSSTAKYVLKRDNEPASGTESKSLVGRRQRRYMVRHEGHGPASALKGEVVLFSACADHQKSADAFVIGANGKPTGALTYAFIEAIESGHLSLKQYTYSSLLKAMRDKLASSGHSQIPQLSTSHPWDLNMMFSI